MTISPETWAALNIDKEINDETVVGAGHHSVLTQGAGLTIRKKMVYFFEPLTDDVNFLQDANTMLKFVQDSERGRAPTVPSLHVQRTCTSSTEENARRILENEQSLEDRSTGCRLDITILFRLAPEVVVSQRSHRALTFKDSMSGFIREQGEGDEVVAVTISLDGARDERCFVAMKLRGTARSSYHRTALEEVGADTWGFHSS